MGEMLKGPNCRQRPHTRYRDSAQDLQLTSPSDVVSSVTLGLYVVVLSWREELRCTACRGQSTTWHWMCRVWSLSSLCTCLISTYSATARLLSGGIINVATWKMDGGGEIVVVSLVGSRQEGRSCDYVQEKHKWQTGNSRPCQLRISD